MMKEAELIPTQPVSVRERFGIDSNLTVMAFEHPGEYVPRVDPNYCFDPEVTLAILAGFTSNRRTLIQGTHGTGKSSHIEQIAARLNWPCLRINLDGHLSRLDFIGKDSIVIKDGMQVEFAKRTNIQIEKNHINGIQSRGRIVMTPHGFIDDDKKAIDNYKIEHKDYWSEVFENVGNDVMDFVIESDENYIVAPVDYNDD